MNHHTFSIYEANVSLNVEGGHYYRSSNIHSSGCFCFEYVWHGGSGHHVVGFSNHVTNRSFISYYHGNGVDVSFLSQPGSTFFYTPISFKQWETGMVCVDTSMSKITLVNRTNTYSTIFPNFSNTGQWFAYLDHHISMPSDLVSLNFGLNPFYNPLPSGYVPWSNNPIFHSCFIVHNYPESFIHSFFNYS